MSDKILLNYKGNLDVSVSYIKWIRHAKLIYLGYPRGLDWLKSKPNSEDLRKRLYEGA